LSDCEAGDGRENHGYSLSQLLVPEILGISSDVSSYSTCRRRLNGVSLLTTTLGFFGAPRFPTLAKISFRQPSTFNSTPFFPPLSFYASFKLVLATWMSINRALYGILSLKPPTSLQLCARVFVRNASHWHNGLPGVDFQGSLSYACIVDVSNDASERIIMQFWHNRFDTDSNIKALAV